VLSTSLTRKKNQSSLDQGLDLVQVVVVVPVLLVLQSQLLVELK
tara:strand:+ start:82 stop:213 length:132 start_codon:yes stop_codon:yes gene_type:complete